MNGGRLDDARRSFEAAWRRVPAYAQAQGHLAEVEAELGEVDSAISRLHSLAETSDDPDYAAQLARILEDVGDRSESRIWRGRAAARYDELIASHPEAFADHAAEFWLAAGADQDKALGLAENECRGSQYSRPPAVCWRGPLQHKRNLHSPRRSDLLAGCGKPLRGRSKRNRHPYCGSMPRFAIEVERTVQLEHTLAHIDQPQPSRFCDLVWGATYAVIGHGKPDATVGPRKPNDNLLCLRILSRIAKCFLHDAVEARGIQETTPPSSPPSRMTAGMSRQLVLRLQLQTADFRVRTLLPSPLTALSRC